MMGKHRFAAKLYYELSLDRPRPSGSMFFYKRPELIREKYFERLGKKKDVSKFKRNRS